ncbi:MAG TPA: hypothetical protein VFZ25_09065 [Chloroflexota bacterium]|nr:hypothetical protein [Chloroflexota bacterium]
MIRALRPTDVMAYVAFCQRLDKEVEAETRGRWHPFRLVPDVAGLLDRSFPLATGHESWVRIEKGQIFGLVSARCREGGDVWDVDQLTVLPDPDAGRTVAQLLERLLGAAVTEGIHKVFLRLPDEDPACDWVRQVGFYPYCREELFYRSELPSLHRTAAVPRLRGRRPVDHQPLFQLYSAVVPFRVRQAEAMTLHEWRWLDGWGHRRVVVDLVRGAPRRDYVLSGEARPVAWLQVERKSRRLALLTDTSWDDDPTDLLRYGMSQLGGGRPAWCPVREYQSGQTAALHELGFSSVGRFVLFARALAVRVPEMKLVPIRAS